MSRLVRSVQDLSTRTGAPDTVALVNRVAAGSRRRLEIRAEMARLLPTMPVILVPEESRLERASWDGTRLGTGPIREIVEPGGVPDRSGCGMTVDAYHEIRRRALEKIDGSGLDPQRDTARLVELLRAAVDDYQRHAHMGETRSLADPDATVRRLLQSVSYFGPLGDLLDRDDVEEIFIEGERVTFPRSRGSASRAGCAELRVGESPGGRAADGSHRSAARCLSPGIPGAHPRWDCASYCGDPAGIRPSIRHYSPLRAPEGDSRLVSRTRIIDARCCGFPQPRHALVYFCDREWPARCRQDLVPLCSDCRCPVRPLCPGMRGDPGIARPDRPRVLLRGPAPIVGRRRGDQPATTGKDHTGDASRPDSCRRSEGRRSLRVDPRRERRMRSRLHHPCQLGTGCTRCPGECCLDGWRERPGAGGAQRFSPRRSIWSSTSSEMSNRRAAASDARRWRSGLWSRLFTKTSHPSPCSGGIDWVAHSNGPGRCRRKPSSVVSSVRCREGPT